MTEEYTQKPQSLTSESDLWNQQKQKAKDAFDFWNSFLVLRQGSSNDQPLSPESISRFMCIIRAVSWVESKHGTAGANQPQRDPMQVGNPNDQAWEGFTGQISGAKRDRFIRGPGATPNYWIDELPGAAKDREGFPDQAKFSVLTNQNQGHSDAGFNAIMSYYWGVVFLIHKINTEESLGSARATYKCGDASIQRMKKGAVAYNGGGDPQYQQKIDDALELIGCM